MKNNIHEIKFEKDIINGINGRYIVIVIVIVFMTNLYKNKY